MNILFAADVPPDPNSGAAGTELRTIAELRKLGHDVDEIWADSLPHRIAHGNLHYLLELPRAYRAVVRTHQMRRRYDVVHVNQGHCYLAAQDHLRAKRTGVFICRSHGLDDHMEEVLRPWRRKLAIRARSHWKEAPGRIIEALLDRHMRLAARYASGFLISSSLDRDYLTTRHGVAPERVGLVSQAPTDRFRTADPVAMTATRLRRILHVAGFNYVKGPQTVAGVVNSLAESGVEFEFTWVCRAGEHASARALLSDTAKAFTRFLDWMPEGELLDVYDKHGIFLYPPLFDGFGKVFLEAMVRGLCVIATPTGGMRDIIRDGENGFLIPFAGVEEAVDRVRRLWASPDAAVAISASAHTTGASYSWERMARETVAFYERVLGLPPKRVA